MIKPEKLGNIYKDKGQGVGDSFRSKSACVPCRTGVCSRHSSWVDTTTQNSSSSASERLFWAPRPSIHMHICTGAWTYKTAKEAGRTSFASLCHCAVLFAVCMHVLMPCAISHFQVIVCDSFYFTLKHKRPLYPSVIATISSPAARMYKFHGWPDSSAGTVPAA